MRNIILSIIGVVLIIASIFFAKKLIANKNEKSKTKEKPVETNNNQLEAIQITINP